MRTRSPDDGPVPDGPVPDGSVPDGSVPDGLVIVDKPSGWTSHDVVGRTRRLARTRRVGHAGTLDPMATGVLVLGIGRATRLLGHLALTSKTYDATIRLGVATTTDDADGDVVETRPADFSPEALAAGVAALTGVIEQVPSSFSAIKVDGVRAYTKARAGEALELKSRQVTVSRFEVVARRPVDDHVDLDVSIDCSSGTYIRALARDLGVALGCGGHLTALRRTRVGPFTLAAARTLDELAESFQIIVLADAVAASFPRRDVDEAGAREVSFGRRLDPVGWDGPYGVFGPDGAVLALLEERGGQARPLVVFAPA